MGNAPRMCIAKKHHEKKRRTVVIDKELRKEKDQDKQIVLLLLGAGDSGKSTIFKQLRIIHQGLTEEERKLYKIAVIGNLINAFQCILRAADHLRLSIHSSNMVAAQNILGVSDFNELTPDIRHDIVKISSDQTIKKIMRQSDIYVPDSTPHFLKHANRILSDDFIPTIDDVLRTRIKSMGITDFTFEMERNVYKVIDVGGQRSERRKWIHYFSEVNAIIFCLALSEYNMVLDEDKMVNRMHESLQLFKEVCTSEWFKSVAVILFLNKLDLFQEKITKVNLDVCFPDYKGPPEYEEASKFIEKKFIQQDRTGQKKIYPHRTIATNTENIQFVFQSVKDNIIYNAISGYSNDHPVY